MSNLIKVYDKSGEMFEMTRINANDATAHLGWSLSPPVKGSKAKEVKPELTPSPVAEEVVEDEASDEASDEVVTPKKGRPKK